MSCSEVVNNFVLLWGWTVVSDAKCDEPRLVYWDDGSQNPDTLKDISRCKAICDKKSECRGFEYNQSDGSCSTFVKLAGAVMQTSDASGYKCYVKPPGKDTYNHQSSHMDNNWSYFRVVQKSVIFMHWNSNRRALRAFNFSLALKFMLESKLGSFWKL